MKLTYVNTSPKSTTAAIYKTGRLVFNTQSSSDFITQHDVHFKLATDGESDNIYIIPSTNSKDLKPSVRQGRVALNIGHVLQKMGIQYKQVNLSYNVTRIDYEGENILQLSKV